MRVYQRNAVEQIINWLETPQYEQEGRMKEHALSTLKELAREFDARIHVNEHEMKWEETIIQVKTKGKPRWHKFCEAGSRQDAEDWIGIIETSYEYVTEARIIEKHIRN